MSPAFPVKCQWTVNCPERRTRESGSQLSVRLSVMTAVADRPLRADAARNAERILRAARDVYGELGSEAPIEAIARRAGVGERTLYRRFPTKGDLISAALDQSIAEDLFAGHREGPCRRGPDARTRRLDRGGDFAGRP